MKKNKKDDMENHGGNLKLGDQILRLNMKWLHSGLKFQV